MKTKRKTKQKILKVFAMCILFLGQSHLMAQTLPSDSPTQIVCVGSLAEPYEVVPIATSSYSWSMIDQSTGNPPLAGIANITNTANDWYITGRSHFTGYFRWHPSNRPGSCPLGSSNGDFVYAVWFYYSAWQHHKTG